MFIKSLWIAPVLVACVFGQEPAATSTPVPARTYSFPPVGLASSETAQINVVNSATPTATPVATAAAPSCSGTITFVNASGATAGTAVSFTTTGSQIYSTQLTFSKLATSGTRAEFVSSVQVNMTSTAQPLCSPVISLETFDSSTGATHVYLSAPATTGFGPVPVVGLKPVAQ